MCLTESIHSGKIFMKEVKPTELKYVNFLIDKQRILYSYDFAMTTIKFKKIVHVRNNMNFSKRIYYHLKGAYAIWPRN